MDEKNQPSDRQQQPPYAQPLPPPPPPSYAAPPLSVWPHMTLGNWIVTMLLLLIPIANIILSFVWAFGSNVNPSKKTYFQAMLIFALISTVLALVLSGLIATFLFSMINFMY